MNGCCNMIQTFVFVNEMCSRLHIYICCIDRWLSLPWQLLICYVRLLYVLYLFVFEVSILFSTLSSQRTGLYHVRLFFVPACKENFHCIYLECYHYQYQNVSIFTWKTFPYPPFPRTFFSSKSSGPSFDWPGFTISCDNWIFSVPSTLEI